MTAVEEDDLDDNFALLLQDDEVGTVKVQDREPSMSLTAIGLHSDEDPVESRDKVDLKDVVQPAPVSHGLGHDSIPELIEHPPSVLDTARGLPESRLGKAVYLFYEVYNPDNLDKSIAIAEKFNERRWELWEQMSIKYKLSIAASTKLFVELFVDALPQVTGQLFSCPPLFSRDETLAVRTAQWRGLLGLTDAELAAKRSLYQDYLNEIISKSSAESNTDETSLSRPSSRNSKFSAETIGIDVARTHQECSFFHENRSELANILRTACAVTGIPYVQGMNEIAAILFFALRNEADTFWLFVQVISELREIYLSDSDKTVDGIYKQIDGVVLRMHNWSPELYDHLERIGFPTQTIVLKWVTTLLSTELTIPDTLKVWDTVLLCLRTGGLRAFSSSLCLGYFACMQETLLEASDLDEAMKRCQGFGKGVEFNIDRLVLNSLANYAFEQRLRGLYQPNELFPLLDTFKDAVNVAAAKLITFWNQ